jgi:hypothetical protein
MSESVDSNVVEAIRRFQATQTDIEEMIDANGVRSFLIRDPDDPRFFRLESEGPNKEFIVTATGIHFPSAPARPRELPAHVPFLPDLPTTLLILPATGATVVRWEGSGSLAEAFEALRASGPEEGWKETRTGSGDGIRKVVLERDNLMRTLLLFDGPHGSDLVLTDELAS